MTLRIPLLALLALASALPSLCTATPAPDAKRFMGEGPDGDDNGQIFACTGVQPTPAVICVRAGAPGGGTGSAASPLASINAAIAAAKAGDVIQVAAGSYFENVALGAFNDPDSRHLTLLGGFDSTFTSRDAGSRRSVIDGGLQDPAVQLHVFSAQTTTLDGFEITRGRGLGTDFKDGYGAGAGVHAVLDGTGTLVISHNNIHDNLTNNYTTDDTRGGGIHTQNQNVELEIGSIRIEDNRVVDNLAGKGAGINVAGRQASVLRNLVDRNISHNDHGGGIYVSTGITLVQDNVIRSNVVGATAGYGWGGGIIIAGAGVGADLRGNLISDNYTPSAGSGVFWDEGAIGTMMNDLVVANQCPADSRSGAALYVDGGPGGPSMVEIRNITIADHVCPGTAPDGAAIFIEDGSLIAITNSILWNNTREFATVTGGTYSIQYSITQESGTGNFLSDPSFANAAAGDYHLRSMQGRYTPGGWVVDAINSPAIDRGDPAADFSLESQPNGGRINLGAYGNTAEASRSGTGTGTGDGIFADGFEP